MPHQCLQCGKLFADGSMDLLKGCSGCGGTKFFFTKEAIGAPARAQLAEKTKTNVREMLEDLVRSGERPDWNQGIWSRAAWEKWVKLEAAADGETTAESVPAPPGSTRKVGVWDVPAEEAPAPKKTLQAQLGGVREVDVPVTPARRAAPATTPPPAAAPAAMMRAEAQPDAPSRPETLRIAEPGTYEIDIERLVEKAPIIVEKDGVYMVHLPSVFDSSLRKKRR